MSIGDDIKKYRLEKGWSQRYLAELVGITRASLCRYESSAEPKFFTAECLLNALGYEVIVRKMEDDG